MLELFSCDIEIIISSIAVVLSAIALLFSIKTHHSSVERERKQATLEAVEALQKEVFDRLIALKRDNGNKLIPDNDEVDGNTFGELDTLMARLDHFSVGIDENIYDYDTAKKLFGLHIVSVYDELKPFIEATRDNVTLNGYSGGEYYISFDSLINQMKDGSK